MEAIISALTFLMVVLLIYGVHRIRVQEREQVLNRLENITQQFKEDTNEPANTHSKINFSSLLSVLGKGFVSWSFTKKIETELSRADIMLRTEEYIGLNIFAAIVGGFIGLIFFGKGSPTFALALIGVMVPWYYVHRKKKQRAVRLNSEIGESLTGMSNSLRAGYSFQQAMDLVSKETIGPLATEYRRTLREINLGITTEQALQNLIERANNDDMELMIGAVMIQRQIGGNLAEIFDNIAETIRQRIRMQGEVKTLTAQGRISGIVIGALPAILFLGFMIIDPTYMKSLTSKSVGWMMLGGAMVSQIIGFIFIRNITNIEL